VDRVALSEAVDPSDPLLKPVRIEGDVVVDNATALFLEVDSLACCVGREQNADRVAMRGSLEGRFQVLAVGVVHLAIEQPKPIAAEPAGIQEAGEPYLGIDVFSEDDNALITPEAVWPTDPIELLDEPLRLAVGRSNLVPGPGS
jgi:hypothetical protein